MSAPLRVIFIAASEDDVRPALHGLGQGGHNVVHVRVDAPSAMEAALDDGEWDIIVAKSCVPSLGVGTALNLLRRRRPETPFLILSETSEKGEAEVRGAFEAGAHDLVVGTDLAGLNLSAERVLREAQLRRRVQAEEDLRESEERFNLLVEGAKEYATFTLDPEGHVTTWNKGAERIGGYRTEEILGEHFSRFYTREDVLADKPGRALREAAEEGRYESEGPRVRKGGSAYQASVVITALRSETGELRGFSEVARDVTERKRTERELQNSLEALLAIYEAGHILGSTLEAEEVGSRLLRLMQRISSSATAVISVPKGRQLQVWRAIGFENLWRRVRYTPQVQAMLESVMRGGGHTFSALAPPDRPTDDTEELMVGLFMPLRIRNRTIGVLEVYGPEAITNRDVIDILLNLTTKAASALENARLYGKLAERERQLQELVGRLLTTQEEERRRVAYEVHDGPTQVAVAAYQHLQAFARDYPPATPDGAKVLGQAVEYSRRTVGESRQIIANLRPTALDDFGLPAAVRLLVETLRADGWRVRYEEALGGGRIPESTETALYRVAQEALTNAQKHAGTKEVRVKLSSFGGRVRLRVRDWGRGFVAGARPGGGPGERVGLAGMRERVALVGGELEIYSEEGVGTLVTADVPLLGEAGKDVPVGGLVQRLIRSGRSSAERSRE